MLLSAVSAHKAHGQQAIDAGLRLCEPYDKALVLTYSKQAAHPAATPLRPPVDRLFERFSTYLYLPALGHYDENPRLLIEAAWLGKRIVIGGELTRTDPVRQKFERIQTDLDSFRLQANDLLFELFT